MAQTSTNIRTLTASKINNVIYVDGVKYSQTDIGAGINAAYADLPSTGGIIVVPAGTYNAATAISIGTNGKPALIQCAPAGATSITYTPTTGSAVTFNFSAGNLVGAGIEGCQFTGPGSGTSTIGITLGGANGASQVALRNIKFTAFGTWESVGNNAFSQTCDHCVILGNGTGFSALSGITNSGESFSFFGSVIGGLSGTASQCLNVTSPLNNLSFVGGSLDQCTFNLTAGQLHFVNVHFENPQATMSTPLFVNAGARISLVNPDFQWNFSSAPTPSAAVSCSSGLLELIGASFFSGSATLTADVNLSGTCEFHEQGTKLSSGFTNFITNGTSGSVTTYGNVWGNNNTAGQITATAFTTLSANPSASGIVRLATGDAMSWRNNANSADIALDKNSSDQLRWNGSAIVLNNTNVFNAAGTAQSNWHFVTDTATLSGGTVTITLSGSAAFTSATTFSCTANDDTGLNPVKVVNNSGSSVTFTGTTTDVIRYICAGN